MKLTIALRVTPKRNKMVHAQTPNKRFIIAVFNKTFSIENRMPTISFGRNFIFRPININLFSMISFSMIGGSSYKKVFNSVVSSNMVKMMNVFIWQKFSFKVLFHNVPMILHAIAMIVNSKITRLCNSWQNFSNQFKGFISFPSFMMLSATVFRSFIFGFSSAIFYRANHYLMIHERNEYVK
jgi:hypothetical protein